MSVQEPLSRDGNEASYHGDFIRDFATPNEHFGDTAELQTLIDAWVLTRADDSYQRLRSALTFLLTSRGIPVIRYGTEHAADGNGDPNENPIANKDNREDMTPSIRRTRCTGTSSG